MIAQLPPVETSTLHFAQPFWIWVGLAVCAGIIALFVRFDRRRETDLAKIVHPRFRQRLTGGFSKRLRNTKRVLWLLAVLLSFIAVARPQKGYEWREVKRKGIDILFAVDTSRSMLAEDLKPNRLERARLGILDFVERLEGDRIGLIPFAGSAFALCPLTLDYGAFRESLNALDTDLIPRQGTDLASAIKEAERLFEENGNNFRVLVLLTDGEDLQGSVADAAKAAEENGMSIYTVGVGSQEGAQIPLGRNDFVRDAQGQIVTTSLDEETLREIAEVTGGLYVPLGRGAEGLNTIYQEKLRFVPKRELKQRLERVPLERFEWPLGAAIILLFLDFLISDRKRERKQRSLPSAARRVKAGAAVSVALFLTMLGSARAEKTTPVINDPRRIYNQGTDLYSKGEFGKATESLRKSLSTPDLKLQQRSYYNLGNSLYRQGQTTLEKDTEATIKTWEEAVKAYSDALALDPKDGDAEFNKKLVEKKLEELKKQENKDQKDEKKDEKKDQEKQDEQKKDEQKDQQEKNEEGDKGDEKKDQKDGEGEKQDEQKSGEGDKDKQEEKKPGEGGNEDQTGQKEEGDPKDENEKPGDERKDGKSQEKEPGEKAGADGQDNPQPGKEGEEKENQEKAQPGEASEERGEKQEMSREQAAQLLQALEGDEKNVIPIPQQRPSRYITPQNSTKGKTW